MIKVSKGRITVKVGSDELEKAVRVKCTGMANVTRKGESVVVEVHDERMTMEAAGRVQEVLRYCC